MNVIGSKHLTQDNRYRILSLLQQNLPLIQIANDLQKDPRAISREIRNHRVKTEKDFQFNTRNEKYTSPCKRCSRFPFVCDGCPTTQYCMYLVKFHYKPESAHRLAQRTLRDARMRLNVDPLHFQKLDQKIYEGVSKGQSLNHIFMHSDEFEISLRSAYRYVELGLLSTSNLDLRRKVRFRKRQTPKVKRVLIDAKIRQNRLYSDYIRFKAMHPGVPVIQIDCIESGKPFKTALLTIHFTDLRFMLGFLMPVKDSENVSKVFLQLQQMLSPEEYKAIFPVILTDRGTEFSNPLAIETHYETGELLTQVFFCDPQASNQKGHIEENHTLVRYVIPRSTNLGHYTQNNIDLLLSHLNSYGRALLGTTPYHLFEIYYGKAILDKIKVKFIQPDQVYLKPDLFSR